MNSIQKLLNFSKDFRVLCNRFSTFKLQNIAQTKPDFSFPQKQIASAKYHTTNVRYDLMEFFDYEMNWGKKEVRVGRAWKTDELRLKSNSDLHKLWFILLKERNMLKTMEHECDDKFELFPNPERLDKVELSMTNLETVVRERNKAYYLLETGETGERPVKDVIDAFGLPRKYRQTEHYIPKFMNKKWRDTHYFDGKGKDVDEFLQLYKEKMDRYPKRALVRDRREVDQILRRFPNVSIDLLKRKYPNVDVDKCVKNRDGRLTKLPRTV